MNGPGDVLRNVQSQVEALRRQFEALDPRRVLQDMRVMPEPAAPKGSDFAAKLQEKVAAPDASADAGGVGRWDGLIESHASRTGVDPSLLRAVMQVESGGMPHSLSKAGAAGLMQLMPGTAAGLGVTDPFDPEQSVRGGSDYLRQMLDRFGDVNLAVAAYNAGPEAVEAHGGVPPYPETQQYVRRVLQEARRLQPRG
jgi:soluble lytic murein transglycosylase-like protein